MRREKGGFWIAFCAVFFYPMGWRERDIKGQPILSIWKSPDVSKIVDGLIRRATESESKYAYAYNVRIHEALPALNMVGQAPHEALKFSRRVVAQNAVWKVATAKHDVLVALYSQLREQGGQMEGFEDIMRTLRQRVNEGPW